MDRTKPAQGESESRSETRQGPLLTLVRHGETAANTGGVWHGSTDTPLSERGERQAERVAEHIAAERMPAAALYASPLQRARRTAEAIARSTGLELVLEEGIREYDLGSWEGMTYSELQTEHRFWNQIKEDPDFAPHGGESPSQVVTRFVEALHRIQDAHPNQRVIVVAHGGAYCMAFAHILDGDYSNWQHVMSNCAVSELVLRPEPELVSFNYTDHLIGI
jgi:broad specificity phosphatase PhoE